MNMRIQGLALQTKLTYAIEHAVLAPSGHNTQPWLFCLLGNGVQILADRRRALPVVDPHDRELVISCGAALFHLRIALRHYGLASEVISFPNGEESDLLAHVVVTVPHDTTEDEEQLFSAIANRRTNRFPFEQRRIPSDRLAELISDAQTEQAWIHLMENSEEKAAVADLISEGDRIQAADKCFRRELAAWVHPNRSDSGDGMPGYAHGIGDLASQFGPFLVRTFDWGNDKAAKDKQLAEGSPLLALLGTDNDSPSAWLKCGQALARLLLRATAAGISASFLNQPIEVDELRPRLAALVERDGYPQILIRMGYGRRIQPTPRRCLEEVVVR